MKKGYSVYVPMGGRLDDSSLMGAAAASAGCVTRDDDVRCRVDQATRE